VPLGEARLGRIGLDEWCAALGSLSAAFASQSQPRRQRDAPSRRSLVSYRLDDLALLGIRFITQVLQNPYLASWSEKSNSTNPPRSARSHTKLRLTATTTGPRAAHTACARSTSAASCGPCHAEDLPDLPGREC